MKHCRQIFHKHNNINLPNQQTKQMNLYYLKNQPTLKTFGISRAIMINELNINIEYINIFYDTINKFVKLVQLNASLFNIVKGNNV